MDLILALRNVYCREDETIIIGSKTSFHFSCSAVRNTDKNYFVGGITQNQKKDEIFLLLFPYSIVNQQPVINIFVMN